MTVAPKLLSAKELADVLHVHPKTVQKYAYARIIPVIKITKRCVRFDLDKCLEALNRRTTMYAVH